MSGIDELEALLERGKPVYGEYLDEADLRDLVLAEATFESCSFQRAQLTNAKLTRVRLIGSFFDEVDAEGIALGRCVFHDTSVGEANMRRASFTNCEFSQQSSFMETCLDGARVMDCVFEDLATDLASMSDSYFRNCRFSRVSFVETTTANTAFEACRFEHLVIARSPNLIGAS